MCVYSLCIETAEVRGKRSWVHVIRCTSSQFLSERGAHIFFGFHQSLLFRIFLNVFRPKKKKEKSKLHFEIRCSKSSKKESAKGSPPRNEANKRTQTGRDRGKMRAKRDLGTFVALFSRRWTSRNSRNVVLGGHVF